MPERTAGDELTQLHAADPVARASLPSVDEPDARALFEVITKSYQTGDGREAEQARRPLVLVAAGVAALVLAGGIGLSIVREPEKPAEGIASAPTPDSTTGAITPGGPAVGSCVEVYDLQTLANREMAFDGTVERVDGDRVTFAVNEWYRGGDSTEITLGGAGGLGGLTSAGPGTALEPGTRLLVAGDGGFAWSCGFTQAYDPALAAQWQDAMRR